MNEKDISELKYLLRKCVIISKIGNTLLRNKKGEVIANDNPIIAQIEAAELYPDLEKQNKLLPIIITSTFIYTCQKK